MSGRPQSQTTWAAKVGAKAGASAKVVTKLSREPESPLPAGAVDQRHFERWIGTELRERGGDAHRPGRLSELSRAARVRVAAEARERAAPDQAKEEGQLGVGRVFRGPKELADPDGFEKCFYEPLWQSSNMPQCPVSADDAWPARRAGAAGE